MKLSLAKNSSKFRGPGKFIVVDGIDGSGKTTQVHLLKQELELSGYRTEYIHFPQHGKPSAVLVDNYLSGKYGHMNPQAASIFFAVDRFEASEYIRQLLQQGVIVLCDRYVTANAAHQGSKIPNHVQRLKFFKWLDNLEYMTFGIPRPDLTIILDVPAEAAIQMIANRLEDAGHIDNMHEASIEHLKNSHSIYLEIAKLFPNTRLVECVKGDELMLPEEIHNKVWELVRRIALKGVKP